MDNHNFDSGFVKNFSCSAYSSLPCSVVDFAQPLESLDFPPSFLLIFLCLFTYMAQNNK